MGTKYDEDAALWAQEQGALLRAGRMSEIDRENVAEEIEAMGRRERGELHDRMSALLTCLIKWYFLPGRRCQIWRDEIAVQRNALPDVLRDSPSLTPVLSDAQWLGAAWADAVRTVVVDTGLVEAIFPSRCPWSLENVLARGYFPEAD